MKRIRVAGLSHKKTPLKIREVFFFDKNEAAKMLKLIMEIKDIEEAMLMSTCNRTEAYFVSNGGRETEDEVIKKLAEGKNLDSGEIAQYFYAYAGRDAVNHIFRVASGLESMVIGETEVTGQFKDAFNHALDNKTAGQILLAVHQAALAAVKKVKNKTAVSKGTVSVSYCAVDAAEEALGPLSDKKILIIGAGEMAGSAAEAFMKKGAKKIDVLNKTYSKAVELAQKYSGRPFGFEAMAEAVEGSDIILASTAAKEPFITADFIKEVMHKRAKKPLLIIDIAVPRDVEDAVKGIKNVHVINIDDLKKISDETLNTRKKELAKSEEIIADLVNNFDRELYMRQSAPAIGEIKEKIYRIALEETGKIAKEQKLTPAEKAMLEKNTLAVVDGIIRKHMGELKKRMEKEGAGNVDAIRAMKEAFKIHE